MDVFQINQKKQKYDKIKTVTLITQASVSGMLLASGIGFHIASINQMIKYGQNSHCDINSCFAIDQKVKPLMDLATFSFISSGVVGMSATLFALTYKPAIKSNIEIKPTPNGCAVEGKF